MKHIYFLMLILIFIPGFLTAETIELHPTFGLIKTGADNSLVPQKGLFKKTRNGFSTRSQLVNIHAHFKGAGVNSLKNFTFTGEMKRRSRNGGVGVTFYSDYPNSDSYYRLRSFPGSDFHIAPHGTVITEGDFESGIIPRSRWYKFKIQISNKKNSTRIRAKIWRSSRREPRNWQIDCTDSSETQLTKGRVGLWSMADGIKLWRNLEIETR